MRTFFAKHPLLQKQKSPSTAAVPPVVQEVLASSGQPLDAATRAFMEPRFGHDFSRVRVHAGAEAAASADAVKARAYTVGQDIVFGRGQLSPESRGGRHLLAHELAHVVQQSRGGPAPAVRTSAAHEHDAEAAATAIASGQASVPVRQGTGVGLARQPQGTTANADDIDEILTLPNITDPRSSPRYIDKLFERVVYSFWNGASVFYWTENGAEQHIGAPLTDLEQDENVLLVPIAEIHNSKDEALKAVKDYAPSAASGMKVFSFYRTPANVIMPTCFSKDSTPQFHALWPALKKGIAAKATEIQEGLAPLANAVNPIPGTEVDENGTLSVSGDPMSWLALARLKNLKRIGRQRLRLHSGYGVKYKVHGPHNKLKGTSVYILKDAQGEVLYVGKGETLHRLREHIKDPNKTQWFGEISEVEVRATDLNNSQALALEETLIGELSPLYNKDLHPFQKEFGTQMAVGPNLPRSQISLRFFLEWGH